MLEKTEKLIPWLIILTVCIIIFSFGGTVLREVAADTGANTSTVTVLSYATPAVGTVILNEGNDITLTENVATTIQATATITDASGYTDISSIEGKIYRSGVGSGCSDDNNNCYSDSACATSSCSGNSCTATCEYDVWFHADPTDTGSPWVSEYWEAWIKAIDASNASSSATSSGVEMNTLLALELSTTTISYGSLNSGSTTESVNQTTTITGTGNTSIDIYLYGTNLDSGSATISVGYQEYSLSNFSYASGTDLTDVTSTVVEVVLSKPTSQPSTSTDDVYWGTEAPSVASKGTYSGTTTFVAKKNWADYDYSHRKSIVIDHNQVDGDLTDFPVLIDVTDSDLTNCRGDGYDIKFYDIDGETQLKHEREYWASSTGDLVAWVQIPSMSSSSDNIFYMYYENSSESTDQQQATSVWDSNFQAVWHLAESATGTRYDSTSNNRDGTPHDYDGDEAITTGQIAGADDFDGTNDYIECPDFDLATDPWTVSFWLHQDVAGFTKTALGKGHFDGVGDMIFFDMDNNGDRGYFSWRSDNVGDGQRIVNVGDSSLAGAGWKYISVTRDTDTDTINTYLDGSFSHSGTTTDDYDFSNEHYWTIGTREDGTITYCINAAIDEVRISNTKRETAWISTSFNNQASTSAFMDFSSEQSQ